MKSKREHFVADGRSENESYHISQHTAAYSIFQISIFFLKLEAIFDGFRETDYEEI
jgi:hypothetical protein